MILCVCVCVFVIKQQIKGKNENNVKRREDLKEEKELHSKEEIK